ncbi:growth hormone secretagogue receptor type 1-like [Chanos chanos]|uniref:Growth hormone secretagogue receptor type 1-like n=1 Tax=Chanos chanos TaxID=29144 RepID=A0A6J2UNC2_CHACN|nr:growth hormone secretagogue receptor type 1-like [Chanos chanos]
MDSSGEHAGGLRSVLLYTLNADRGSVRTASGETGENVFVTIIDVNMTRTILVQSDPSALNGTLSLFETQTLVPITVLCLLLFLLGMGGNVGTLFVFQRYRQLRSNTNLYLASMALSDMLIFLGLPFDLYRLWSYQPYPFGDFLCRFLLYLSEVCTYTTVLHITALSVERYLAVCFPFHVRRVVTRSRARLIIALLWGLGGATAGPVFFLFHVEGQECRPSKAAVNSGLLKAMIWLSTLYFFLPLACLCLLYSLICRRLRHRQNQGFVHRQHRKHRHTVTLLGLMVLAFTLCWLPFHVGRVLFSSVMWTGTGHRGDEILYTTSQNLNLASMVLFYFSASVNPLLYSLLSVHYRHVLQGLLHPQASRGTPHISLHSFRSHSSIQNNAQQRASI